MILYQTLSQIQINDSCHIKRNYVYPTLSGPPVMWILLLQGHIIYGILHPLQLCE